MRELEGKQLVLFGAAEKAKEFYRKYHCIYNIIGCISNNESERQVTMYDGVVLPVNRPGVKNSGGEKIIICSSFYSEISKQLYFLGYIPYEDFFCDYEIQELGDKQIVCFFGKCHVISISFLLSKMLATEKYKIVYRAITPDNYKYTETFGEIENFRFYAKHCSVFIYGIDTDLNDNEELKWWMHYLPGSCKKISMPYLAFWAYFPSNKINNFKLNELSFRQAPVNAYPFGFGDDLINSMIKDGCSLEQILDRITDEDLFSKEYLLERLDKNLKVIKLMSRNTDINMFEWINNNFRSEQIFRDLWHPNDNMAYEITAQILEIMGEGPIDRKRYKDCSDYPIVLSIKHILYPCVFKHLKLEWDFDNSIYEINSAEGMKKVTFYEYVTEYVKMSKLTLELQNKKYIAKINSVKDFI